jgi:uncharacterized protein YegL
MMFYLICDVSQSMQSDMYDLNDGLGRLRAAILADPVVDDMVQVCVMSFSDGARVLMPTGHMRTAARTRLSAEGGTNYGAAFRELAAVIDRDTANLTRLGLATCQRCAFFITDGAPEDADWHQTFTATLACRRSLSTNLIFVPFGFRDAPEQVLRQLAYPPSQGKWYYARAALPEQALTGIVNVIIKTVACSGRDAAEGKALIVPQPAAAVSGMVRGDSEFDPSSPRSAL